MPRSSILVGLLILLFACEFALAQQPAPPTTGPRTWTDITGNYKVEAEFVALANGKVTLKKTDGQTVMFDLTKLSFADRKIAIQLSKEPAPNPNAVDPAPMPVEPAPAAGTPPDIGTALAADKLVGEFKAGGLQVMLTKYHGKQVEVGGVISAAERQRGKPGVALTLKGGNGPGEFVYATFEGDAPLGQAAIGQTLVVKGEFVAGTTAFPLLKDCQVVKVTGPAPARFTTKQLAAKVAAKPAGLAKEFQGKALYLTGKVESIAPGGTAILASDGRCKFKIVLHANEADGPTKQLKAGSPFYVVAEISANEPATATSLTLANALMVIGGDAPAGGGTSIVPPMVNPLPMANPLPMPAGKAELEMTAEKLSAEFKENQEATIAKYKLKTVDVTGVVLSVARLSFEPPQLRFVLKGGDGAFDQVQCEFSGGDPLSQATPGQTVTFRGTFETSDSSLAPFIHHCQVVKATGAGAVSMTTKQLAMRYGANPAAFKKEFDNNYFIISGVVGSIGTDLGGPAIFVQEGKTKLIIALDGVEKEGGLKTLKAGSPFRAIGQFLAVSNSEPSELRTIMGYILPPAPAGMNTAPPRR